MSRRVNDILWFVCLSVCLFVCYHLISNIGFEQGDRSLMRLLLKCVAMDSEALRKHIGHVYVYG